MKNYTGEDNGDAHLKRQIGEDGKKTKIGFPSYCPLKKAENPFWRIYL